MHRPINLAGLGAALAMMAGAGPFSRFREEMAPTIRVARETTAPNLRGASSGTRARRSWKKKRAAGWSK